MPPETPRGRSDFLMTGLCRKFIERPEENTVRTMSRVEPQFCASGGQINRIVQHVIARSEKHTVPFLRQSLPVQIVGRSCPSLSRRDTCTVLMNDHCPHGVDAVG